MTRRLFAVAALLVALAGPSATAQIVVDHTEYPNGCGAPPQGRTETDIDICRSGQPLPPIRLDNLSIDELVSKFREYLSEIANNKQLYRVEQLERSERAFDIVLELSKRDIGKIELLRRLDIDNILLAQKEASWSVADESTIHNAEAALAPEEKQTAEQRSAVNSVRYATLIAVADGYLTRTYEIPENIERAIFSYRAALQILTAMPKDEYPNNLVNAQRGLAIAYLQRRYGFRVDNLTAARSLLLSLQKLDNTDDHHEATISDAMNQNYLGKIDLEFARLFRHGPSAMSGKLHEYRDNAITHLEAAYRVKHEMLPPWSTMAEVLRRSPMFTRDPGESRRIAIALADAYAEAADDRGLEWVDKAVGLLEQTNRESIYGDDLDRGRAACALGDLYLRRGPAANGSDAARAVVAYNRGLTLFTAMRTLENRLICLRGLAEAHTILREWPAASAAAVEGLALLDLVEASGDVSPELSWALGDGQGLAEAAAYAAWKRGDVKAAWQRLEDGRARTFMLALDSQGGAGSSQTRALSRQLHQRSVQLSASLDTPASDVAGTVGELLQIQNRLLDLRVKTIRSAVQASVDGLEAQLDRALRRVDVVVAPAVTRDGAVLLTARRVDGRVVYEAIAAPDLTSDAVARILYGTSRSDQASWTNIYTAAAGSGATERDRERWQAEIERFPEVLRDRLARPLGKAIGGGSPGGGRSGVLILLPGSLASFPIGLLKIGLGPDTLGDRFDISYAPTIAAFNRTITEATPILPSAKAVVVAEADPSSAVGSAEGPAVASWFQSPQRLFGLDATDAKFRNALGTDQVFHIASHGIFDTASPGRSGVRLANNVTLSAEEIRKIGYNEQLRLVFLSACESGITYSENTPESFVGLPSAFLEVGAHNVVASLWRIPETSASLFAMRFYELYFGAHMSISSAIRSAQRWLRESSAAELIDYVNGKALKENRLNVESTAKLLEILQDRDPASTPFARPYYWGGYVVFGRQ